MQKSEAVRLLQHAVQYCDEWAGIIMYDPEHEFDALDHVAYSQAASIMENLCDAVTA